MNIIVTKSIEVYSMRNVIYQLQYKNKSLKNIITVVFKIVPLSEVKRSEMIKNIEILELILEEEKSTIQRVVKENNKLKNTVNILKLELINYYKIMQNVAKSIEDNSWEYYGKFSMSEKDITVFKNIIDEMKK